MSGKLIVFEGTDGSGKATQAELLCRALEGMGIPYRKVLAEENPDLTTRYSVRQAPTLVFEGQDGPAKVVGLGPIRQFIQENRPASVG